MAMKILATNRKANHEYSLLDKLEAGIALQGTEVKALRDGRANLVDGWISIDDGEVFLRDVHIGHYSHGNIMNHAEKRVRKLLLHRREIERLEKKIAERGLTVIPLKFYFKGRCIKVEIAVAKGKKSHDKRESAKEQQANRDISRAMRQR